MICEAPFLAGVAGWVACGLVAGIWLLWEVARAPVVDDDA